MDPVGLAVFAQRLASIGEQMGAVLERSAYSPNIKERRDFSCALFDARGRLLAQAAHIPVHLGSMEESVLAVATAFEGRLRPGDMVLLNDPFQGGSHLPDLTLVAPLFAGGDRDRGPLAYVANRAHHADIGGKAPGSLPADSTRLEEEGLVLPPTLLVKAGQPVAKVWDRVCEASRTPREREGDLRAQVAANRWGCLRLAELIDEGEWAELVKGLLAAGEAAARNLLGRIPKGNYTAEEVIHDAKDRAWPLKVNISSDAGGSLTFDFAGTGPQHPGNLNAPASVTRAAVRYVAYCLMSALDPEGCPPANHGAFASFKIEVPKGSLLNPQPRVYPPGVAAGNVETSQRVVDLLLVALAPALPAVIPAHSQGTMNNLLIGAAGPRPFAYYETLGGGCGAPPSAEGASATHSHMTNTLNTPVEALEHAYPLRVEACRILKGTGGHGIHKGGDGLERWLRLLAPKATLTLLSSRRATQPQGLAGGGPGLPGEQWVEREGQCLPIPAKATLELEEGDVVVVRTPGGGGWGSSKWEK